MSIEDTPWIKKPFQLRSISGCLPLILIAVILLYFGYRRLETFPISVTISNQTTAPVGLVQINCGTEVLEFKDIAAGASVRKDWRIFGYANNLRYMVVHADHTDTGFLAEYIDSDCRGTQYTLLVGPNGIERR
jgi:hypothetical protein